MARRYPALRFVSSFFRILALVAFAVGVLAFMSYLGDQGDMSDSDKLSAYVGGILLLAAYSAFIYALGEIINVFLAGDASVRGPERCGRDLPGVL